MPGAPAGPAGRSLAPLQGDLVREIARMLPTQYWVAVVVFAFGLVLGLLVWRLNRAILTRAGVPEAIEGTAFERTAREFGTTTVDIVASLSALFVVIVSTVVAFAVADVAGAAIFSTGVASFLLRAFLAALIVIGGVLVGDKAELLVSERLRSVKIPEASVIPTIAKYTVFYLAALLALAQIGVDVLVLVLLFGVYAFALVLFGAIALKDLLTCGAAGMYLLLSEPYGIGDEVRIGDTRGIVQEIDVFVTRVESDDEEFVVPNRKALRDGIVRIRD